MTIRGIAFFGTCVEFSGFTYLWYAATELSVDPHVSLWVVLLELLPDLQHLPTAIVHQGRAVKLTTYVEEEKLICIHPGLK